MPCGGDNGIVGRCVFTDLNTIALSFFIGHFNFLRNLLRLFFFFSIFSPIDAFLLKTFTYRPRQTMRQAINNNPIEWLSHFYSLGLCTMFPEMSTGL